MRRRNNKNNVNKAITEADRGGWLTVVAVNMRGYSYVFAQVAIRCHFLI